MDNPGRDTSRTPHRHVAASSNNDSDGLASEQNALSFQSHPQPQSAEASTRHVPRSHATSEHSATETSVDAPSIASYYHRNADTSEGQEQDAGPSREGNVSQRHAPQALENERSHRAAGSSYSTPPVQDFFADWSDNLHGDGASHALADTNDVLGGRRQELLTEPLYLSADDKYEGQTTPRGGLKSSLPPSSAYDKAGRHSRFVSSATEGDVGASATRPYGAISPNATESIQSLDMEFNAAYTRASPSESPSEAPVNDYAIGPDKFYDESEIAGLTSNSANIGWINAGKAMVHSPDSNIEDNSPQFPPLSAGDSDGTNFDRRTKYQKVERNGIMQGDVEDNPRPVSSADMYNAFSESREEGRPSRARQRFDKMGQSFRRISRRVVNLEGNERPNREGRIRLPDNDEADSDEDYAFEMQHVPIASAADGLRGKSLGIFGPTSSTRRALAAFMTQWWIEPVILCAILFNAILLIIQSARNVYTYPRKPGYFDYWTDYALLSVFCIYTIEAVARIVVSGLVINPPAAEDEIGDLHGSVTDVNSFRQRRKKARTSDPRANVMRSNTKDTFAALGESVKSKASHVLKPHQGLHLGRTVSPNRQLAPRIVRSNQVYPQDAQDEREQVGTNPASTPGRDSLLHGKTSKFLQMTRLAPFAHAIVLQRAQAVDYAYLRHSWNRIDFIAVTSFWVAFLLSIFYQEDAPAHHIYVFRALSVLRVSRLLTATHGTSVILRSLKTAAPILVNVAFFTLFSMLLFSVIGVQSFEGNYKRSCVWIGDLQTGLDYAPGVNYTLGQLCGGHLDAVTGQQTTPLSANGNPLHVSIKGFICPQGQVCMEGSNPQSGTESFDNILEALLQVVIITSLNGWSTIMYNMIDADYYASCLYFIIGVIFLNFWMANLFVAVITNTFATISAETKQSAFAAERIEPARPIVVVAEPTGLARHRQRAASAFKRIWSYTKYLWLGLIVADLGVQASQASYHRSRDNDDLLTVGFYFTIAFDAEIMLRFFSFLLDNDWRSFFTSRRNRFDLFLAVVTSIMQIPVILRSQVYAWLTAFQLARFYRVIAAVPRMESLLIRVFGSMTGLFNMILFLLMMVGLASLIAAQLFRGDVPQAISGQPQEINFKTIYNSFLGMYQIFSSENWTTPLYSVLMAEGQYKQAVIAGIFIGAWFLFANFIVLQMFIAVIAENFGVAEGQKRTQQLEQYLRNLEKPDHSWGARLLNQLSPYRWLRERNAILAGEKEKSHHGKELAQEALDKLDEKARNRRSLHGFVTPKRANHVLKVVRQALRLDRPEESVPLNTVRARNMRNSLSGASVLSPQRGTSVYDKRTVQFLTPANTEETARAFARDRQLTRMRSGLGLTAQDGPNQAEIDEEHQNRWKNDPRIAQAQLINTHPSYEKSLWLFSNTSNFRRSCQSFVPCSYGERLFGRRTSPFRLRVYQALLFGAVAASVSVAGVATPKYRRDWYAAHGLRRDSWFSMAEIILSITFILEFFVKVIADGFAFTPNAYLLSPWNALDLFVLVTLVVNVSTELAVIGGVSRFTRALKAFRALRLINLSTLLRRTFSGLVAGAGPFLDASVLAILYIVPFAIWGQNLFSGLLFSCTDTSPGILTKGDCINEYSASPSQWNFLAPRAWQNPTQGSMYSFDDFRSSLLILFEIVSLEGWTNVMTTAMSVSGFNQQLQTDARQVNALFFVIYNLIGAIFVLTLFVAVIIESFQSFSGAAFQTAQQRQWIDLKRQIARQRPSKRPKQRPSDPLRSWCFDRATRKNGWWSRWMTLMFLAALITLATQTYGDRMGSETARDAVYIVVSCFYAADILIRLAGLGWRSYRQDAWNLFDLMVVTGTLATSIPLLRPRQGNMANLQVQKIFLVAMAFKLVQKNNALNQLFKTAVSSLPSVASLFLLWLTMFLTWGIMLVEVFGLTAWGINETHTRNFSTLINSLVFLSMMSTGEGWNSYMHDFTLSSPLCSPSSNYLNTDCGSVGWAYFLFISWNVISMYIFLNMFTGTVVENFSYVFQLGGKPTLSREQVRNFKQAWSLYDTGRSGYIPREKFVPFFNQLEGSLELRVHPRGADIQTLKAKSIAAASHRHSMDSSATSPSSPIREAALRLRLPGAHKHNDLSAVHTWSTSPEDGLVVAGLSIPFLKQQLDSLNHDEIQRKRLRFEHIYHEAMILSERPQNRAKGGISFSDMLLLIAHYKLIDDEQALSVAELVERREVLQHVEDRIETERVRGLLRQMWLRRRFLAMQEERHRLNREREQQEIEAYRQSLQIGTVPEITVDAASHDDRMEGKSRIGRPALRLDTGNFAARNESPGVGPSQLQSRTHVLREADVGDEQPSIHLTTTDDESLAGSDDDRSTRKHDGESERSRSHYVPSLHNSTAESERGSSLSRSASFRELERRASPIIQEIDQSAWGAIARRLPEENTVGASDAFGASSAQYGHSQTSLQSRRTSNSFTDSLGIWGAATAAARRFSSSARGGGGSSSSITGSIADMSDAGSGRINASDSGTSIGRGLAPHSRHTDGTRAPTSSSQQSLEHTAEMRQVETMGDDVSLASPSSMRSRFSR